MTIQEFVSRSQGYYGRYTEEQKKTVINWLSEKKEREIGYIYAEVLKALSAVYKTPPGIKELEDAYRIIRKERYREIYPSLPEPLPEKASKETIDKLTLRLDNLIDNLVNAKKFK